MATYTIRGMAHLSKSKDPKDRAIVDFASNNGIRTLSYKDYKYLYCLLVVDGISKEIGGQGIKDLGSSMKLWLEIARAESKIEQCGRMVQISGLSKEDLAAVKPVLEGELKVKSLSELVPLRIRLGKAISHMLCRSVGGESRSQFWEKISIAMVLLDNLADFARDRISGLLPRVDFRGLAQLVRELSSCSFHSFRTLGFYRSLKFLAIPSILVLKGGIENERKKEEQKPIFQNTRQTCQSAELLSRI